MFVLAKIFIDSDSRTFAVTYAVDNQARSENAIATSEDPGRRSHKCLRIDRDQATWRKFHFVFRREEVEARGLADGHDDGVALDQAFTAIKKRGIETSVLIENPFGFESLKRNHLAVSTHHPLGPETRMHSDAFFFGFFNFF